MKSVEEFSAKELQKIILKHMKKVLELKPDDEMREIAVYYINNKDIFSIPEIKKFLISTLKKTHYKIDKTNEEEVKKKLMHTIKNNRIRLESEKFDNELLNIILEQDLLDL
jgi:hypothetical protein